MYINLFYRFSIRPNSRDNKFHFDTDQQTLQQKYSMPTTSAPLPSTPVNSRTLISTKSSTQNMIRPRSSASIPGRTRYDFRACIFSLRRRHIGKWNKCFNLYICGNPAKQVIKSGPGTKEVGLGGAYLIYSFRLSFFNIPYLRYILLKPDCSQAGTEKLIPPSKQEEELLRKRFPWQHLSVMKSLGRLDETASHDLEQEPRSSLKLQQWRKGSDVHFKERGVASAPSGASCRDVGRKHKSETYALLRQRKNSQNSSTKMAGRSELTLESKTSSTRSNVNVCSLDIVKRKSNHYR